MTKRLITVEKEKQSGLNTHIALDGPILNKE